MENYNNEYGYNFDPLTGERISDKSNDEYIGMQAENSDEMPKSEADPAFSQEDSVSMNSFEEKAPESGKKSRKNRKEKKPMSLGKKFGVVVAMAVIFGLVGGSIFYGVNYIGSRLLNYRPSIVSEASASSAGPSEDRENVSLSKAAEVSEASAENNSKKEMTPIVDSTGSTATQTKGTVEEVAKNCMPSLVTIASVSVMEMQNFFGQTQQYEVEGAGSGVIVGMNDTELLIATNNHVVSNSRELSVGFIDESSVEAYVKGTDPSNDLAIVGVKLEYIDQSTLDQIKVATIGNSTTLVLGEGVVAIGNALGIGQSVTSGVVSALGRDMQFSDGSYTINSTDLIQTDAPINSGNSGGGLFNMKGELIGINEAKSSMTSSGTTVDGVGFAISISKAEPILENLMNLETRDEVAEENRGYLGVTCANVTPDMTEIYGVPQGVCFTSVLEGSPAYDAGAKKGDVLISFDGRNIDSYETLTNTLNYYASGEEVPITVMRSSDGEYVEVELTITLGDYGAISSLQKNG